MEAVLTKHQAIDFLELKLGLTDVETKLKTTRLELVNEIIMACIGKIPWQNMTPLAKWPDRIPILTLADIVELNLSLEGGVCYDKNLFSFLLLDALGFNSSIIMAEAPDADCSHQMTLVRDLVNPGDIYIVDIGLLFPTFQAMPIHDLQDGESHSYFNLFHHYRIINKNGRYYREHKYSKKGIDHIIFEDTPTGELWYPFCYFQLEKATTDPEVSLQELNTVRASTGYSFYRTVYFTIYPTQDECVSVVDLNLYRWANGSSQRQKTVFENEQELIEYLGKWPMLQNVDVAKAVENWKLALKTEALVPRITCAEYLKVFEGSVTNN